ncbi:MAG: class I SAM-dependent methyltransferase [Ferruginibacter sp.]|nr:class I SAM-dependent methyltransferase [Chitinophagaceae bacterium]
MLSRIKNKLKLLLPGNAKKVFSLIYKKNSWGSEESISGPGSTIAYTTHLRQQLPGVLASLGIKTLLDAPCGDCHWISQVDLSAIAYTGADIVPELIESNKINHPQKNFITADIARDKLPAADMVLCRDCFIHLRKKEIIQVIQNFKRSGIKYMLASTYPVDINKEILTGHFRPVNLELSPFGLPVPLQKIKDHPEGATPRFLALWLLEDVKL